MLATVAMVGGGDRTWAAKGKGKIVRGKLIK